MSEFAAAMSQLQELEIQIKAMVLNLCEELAERVAASPMEGVQQISDHPKVAIVKLSTLSKCNNWSADYYIQSAQAEAVRSKLLSCKSADSIVKAVRDMIADKKVKKSSNPYDITYLNEATVRVLQESEIGKYVQQQDVEYGMRQGELQQFEAAYDQAYAFLRDSHDSVVGYKALVKRGEHLMSNEAYRQLLTAFFKSRGYATTDRECAALAMAIENMEEKS